MTGCLFDSDVSARSFYDPILVHEFLAEHFHFNISRPLSDQERLKVFLFVFYHSFDIDCYFLLWAEFLIITTKMEV